jgi:hypothetical protein
VRILWDSFRNVVLPVLTVCGFALAWLAYAGISGDVKIPLYVAAALVSAGLLVMSALAEAVYRIQNASRPILPAILTVQAPRNERSGILCLLGPSPLFSVGMAVSFSWLDDHGFEVQVGFGQVLTVQQDGRVQAALTIPIPGYQDTLSRMENNDKEVLEKILVRPYVSFQALADVQV